MSAWNLSESASTAMQHDDELLQQPAVQQFLAGLQDSLQQQSLERLILSKYKGLDAGLEKMTVRPVVIKQQALLSFVYRYNTRDITKNFAPPEAIQEIRQQLAAGFKQANLSTQAGEYQLMFSKKDKAALHEQPIKNAVQTKSDSSVAATAHNREKHRFVTQDRPYLQELGVTDQVQQVIPAMSRKWKQLFGLIVYGTSMVLLFLASTLYHSIQAERSRTLLKQLDHCAIYLLIAGTYTPFLMISLNSHSAYILLAVLWGLAAIGIVFKLFFVHRFAKVSLITYLLMGWLALFLIPDIYRALPRAGFDLLVAGGLCYTIGTLFYAAKRYPFTHAVWHLFVIGGAACHCIAVYSYVLPVV